MPIRRGSKDEMRPGALAVVTVVVAACTAAPIASSSSSTHRVDEEGDRIRFAGAVSNDDIALLCGELQVNPP